MIARKKILIVLNYYDPYISGVSEYAKSLASELCKYHTVTVLTSNHTGKLKSLEVQNSNIKIIRAHIDFKIDKGYFSLDFIKLFLQLSRSHDIINLHLPMIESGFLSLLTNKPIITTYHCDLALVGTILNKLAVSITRASMYLALLRSHKIIISAQDYGQSSNLLRLFRKKLIEVNPPNKHEEKCQDIKMSTDIPVCQTIVCGFVGRLVTEKGIDVIIEAAKEFSKDRYPVKFMLAGDYLNVAGGSIYENIKHDLDSLSNVEVLGRLDNAQLVNFYKSIDILLLPSTNRYEAFGMVQLEAMSYGALVVASKMPGVRTTVSKTMVGSLCEPGSVLSLISAIKSTIIQRRTLSRLDVRSILFKTFNNANFINKYLSIVDKL